MQPFGVPLNSWRLIYALIPGDHLFYFIIREVRVLGDPATNLGTPYPWAQIFLNFFSLFAGPALQLTNNVAHRDLAALVCSQCQLKSQPVLKF